jgi:hypothetical protein
VLVSERLAADMAEHEETLRADLSSKLNEVLAVRCVGVRHDPLFGASDVAWLFVLMAVIENFEGEAVLLSSVVCI